MRRPLLALVAALVGVVAFAPPAAAGGTTDIVIGAHDGSFVVQSVPTATVASTLAQAERRPEVAWVEVDREFEVAAETPNDVLYSQQWGPPLVDAPEAWSRTTGDSSVVVAVLDTGVDAGHPDLAGAVLAGRDFVGDGLSGDPNGHGTGVAGVIAARGDNTLGIAGYCWTCSILPVRVLDAEGSGTSSGIASGITWAADNGADIINLSLAGPQTSTTLERAIAGAREKGVLVVAAAGNQTASGQDLTVPQYPAASPGVVGVVATTSSDAAYPWTFRGTWNDVTAPGCALTTKPGGSYETMCGTSFAAPAVAGLLGLALAAFPAAEEPTVVPALVDATAPTVGTLAAGGRVDADGFLDAVAASLPTEVVAERVAGTERIGTSVALSERAFTAAGTVVLARADAFIDALLATPLAGRLGAPVLLSDSTGLTAAVADEIVRLGATDAVLVGGTSALGAGVTSDLQALGVSSRRVAGATPYDTAALIADELGGTSAFVAQAGAWPDAVSVSALAALTETPILLVDRDAVPAATASALSRLGTTEVTLIGGTAVISSSVQSTLDTAARTVTRLAGTNRYETSKQVATATVAAGGEAQRTWFVTGGNWPDALAAGPASGAQRTTLLLVDGSAAETPTATSWLQSVEGLRELVVVGGEAAISSLTVAGLEAAL